MKNQILRTLALLFAVVGVSPSALASSGITANQYIITSSAANVTYNGTCIIGKAITKSGWGGNQTITCTSSGKWTYTSNLPSNQSPGTYDFYLTESNGDQIVLYFVKTASASCTFNGKTIASGGTVSPNPYTTSSVSYGQTCTTETVTCNNGVLSPSGASATCTVAPAPTPPPTYTASLSWSAESGVAGYKVYYGTASRNYSSSINIGNPATVGGVISYQVTNLSSGTIHYFTVTSYNSSGVESPYASEWKR